MNKLSLEELEQLREELKQVHGKTIEDLKQLLISLNELKEDESF